MERDELLGKPFTHMHFLLEDSRMGFALPLAWLPYLTQERLPQDNSTKSSSSFPITEWPGASGPRQLACEIWINNKIPNQNVNGLV